MNSALQYAYIQFADRSAWKFNKARQNWLLRNVWSEEMVSLLHTHNRSGIVLSPRTLFQVPETYFTLACHYLQTVQGGVREVRLRTMQVYVDSTDVCVHRHW